ncbi:hypothetical protein FPSE_06777 [Fusarium pseudograminearum CS3096]|uniref:Aminoglycoside phosphotransferase domain-containing protein n=1 Tax=Fusarium pseudograminearum (strain CS3096) TaxID=1028729 RepID=K3VG12_FUSPC|nr:hypothetical protein FPSE_06777 [Fusarium pseudograminearum CS3096]EKJ72989.1 hypothetical protein FPSE_06777 [Fusarium pseudograminearum CS3096]
MLVRRSAAIAFSQGHFKFKFSKDPNYHVWQVWIGGPGRPSVLDNVPMTTRGAFKNHSDSEIPFPDKSLLKAFSRFTNAIRWYHISVEIALQQQKPPPVSTALTPSFCHRLSEYGAVLFSAFCRLMPSPLRAQIYRGLWFLGARLYGPSCSFNVQRLPFGMYLKTKRQEHQSLASEYGALQYLRRLTHIPVPRPLDLVCGSDISYMLTTRLPGHPVGLCLDSMSDAGVDAFNNELKQYLSELRALPKPVGIKHAICNAVGGPLYDYRMIAGQDYDKDRGDHIQPFATEEDFNNKLQTPALPGVCHKSGHQIVLTHADINMRNILYHNGRISGIIDKENAGWFPDYWEYTKALYVTKVNRRWLSMMDRVFATFGDFREDYVTERKLWDYCYSGKF